MVLVHLLGIERKSDRDMNKRFKKILKVRELPVFLVAVFLISTGFLVSIEFQRELAELGGWEADMIPYAEAFFPPLIGNNRTYYFRSDSHNVSGVFGYKLNLTPSASLVEDSRTDVGETSNISYGVRVWVVTPSGVELESTSGSPVAIVTRTSDGDGIQSATWTCPEYTQVVDAFHINVYQRFNQTTWSLRRIFVTSDDLMIEFPEGEWTFYYYTNRTIDGADTVSYYKFGVSSHNSRVATRNKEADPFDIQLFELVSGNLFQAVVSPWTVTMGGMFYVFAFFFMAITTYNRYGSIRIVLGIMWLFGGAGSVLSLLLLPGMGVAYVILLLAVAFILYDLFM